MTQGAEGDVAPLAAELRDALLALRRRWSDETGVRAEPWSM